MHPYIQTEQGDGEALQFRALPRKQRAQPHEHVFVGANGLHARGAEAGGHERFETWYRVGASLLYQGLGFRVWGLGFGIWGLFFF